VRFKSVFPAIVLVAAMFAVAEHTGQKEIIFPEIAALALGAWIMEKSPWESTPLHFWISPTLAALTGVLIVRFFAYAPFFMITAAFCLVVVQLKLARSAVLPSLSAAILPVITHSDSWHYPLSVCVLTGMIAVGRMLNPNDSGKMSVPANTVVSGDTTPSALDRRESVHWIKLLAGVSLVTAVAVGFDHIFMVAPPLIVAFVEVSKPGGTARKKAGRAMLLLVLAAFSGVFWLHLIHYSLHLQIWVSACMSTATVLLFYHALRMPFPPAVAIALLPTILPEHDIRAYPWQVLAGSAAFFTLSRACFGNNGFLSARTKETPVAGGVSVD
jgi:hypothetical protein